MLLVDGLIMVPVLSILAHIPMLCYLDLRYREVPYWFWTLLLVINIPVAAYLYLEGFYPIYSLAISLLLCGIFYAMQFYRVIEGADFTFLSVISMFYVINPFPLPHGIMQPVFYFVLLFVMFISAVILLCINYSKGYRLSLFEMMSTYEDGVPFILPISAAFVLTVVFG